MYMRKLLLTLCIAATLPLAATAQRYFGIATSNWSGTNSLYLNPANIADSRHRFTIDLFSVNFGFDNNLGTINRTGLMDRFYRGDSVNINDVFRFNANQDKFDMTAPYVEVRGPGFMWAINSKHSIALTTRLRGFNQLTDFDQDLYRYIADRNYDIDRNNFQLDAFNWNANVWSEIGLSYATVLYNKEKHMLKGGITVRYLGGIGYVNARSNGGINATYDSTQNTLTVSNADIQFNTNVLNTDEELSSSVDAGDIFSRFFGAKGGSGIGGDVGLVYEYRPNYMTNKYDMDGQTGITDRSVNNYKFRIGVSVTDIGAITYRNNNNSGRFSGSGTINGDDLEDSVGNYENFKTYMENNGFNVDTTASNTKMGMPTALLVNVDYNIYKNFYANLTYVQGIASRTADGNYYYNQITLTPRYDVRTFSVGLPITYNMLTQNVRVGLGARIAGFFVGSDDLLAMVGSNTQYGTNIYFGAYVPINKRKPRDNDGDLVSNKRDECPNEKGVLEMKGCPNPDKDGDGILDKDDKCPDVAGSKTAMGCPDGDLDSVADAGDRCPTEAGMVSLQGCPDRDRDGIADGDDICPDLTGLAQFSGCPDTDGDGIGDNEDKCVDKPGPAANQGCPDTDNDGIPDHLDRCPTVAGTANNRGCPEIRAEVRKRLAFAATAIQFETGKAIIKKKSYPLLNEIVKILNDYPDYIMTIDGHTDDVGTDVSNLQLSKDRAASVKAYFVSQGIPEARIVTNGYGETQPAATNKTAAGRAKNRRVAMDLILRD